MKHTRYLAVLTTFLLSFCLLFFAVPVLAQSSGFSLTATADLTEVKAGDTVTVTVSLREKSAGVAVGSFYFKTSDGLTILSASCGDDEFSEVINGDNSGAFVYSLLSVKNRKFSAGTFCTATVRVEKTAVGTPSVTFYGYDLIGEDFGVVTSDTVSVKLTVKSDNAKTEDKTTADEDKNEAKEETVAEPAVSPDVSDETGTKPTAIAAYSDVPATHWAHDYILLLTEAGIVTGNGKGLFQPERAVTRAELIKLIAGLDGVNVSGKSTASFSDVNANDWFMPYVAWASEVGITNGTGNGTFSPNRAVTREEAATLLYRAIRLLGLPNTFATTTLTFADRDEIASYAKEAVGAMQSAGILTGIGGNRFAPKGTTSRAAASKMIAMLFSAK